MKYSDYHAGADPEPQDRGCTGDINEIAININTKSAYRIVSDNSPFLVRVVVRDGGWSEETLVSEATYLVTKRHYALRCQLSI